MYTAIATSNIKQTRPNKPIGNKLKALMGNWVVRITNMLDVVLNS